jgi:hypothetical protein
LTASWKANSAMSSKPFWRKIKNGSWRARNEDKRTA